MKELNQVVKVTPSRSFPPKGESVFQPTKTFLKIDLSVTQQQ
jgi:hypothetical protein